MKLRAIVLGAVVAAVGAILTGVALAGAAKPQAQSPIVLGMAIGLTGFMTAYDGGPSAAAQIAIDDINKKGGVLGHPLKVIKSDTKSDINQGTNAAQEVISKGAQIVLVSCDYDYGGAAARVAASKGKLAFSLCAESPKFGVQGIGPLAFTMGTGTPEVGALMAEYMYKKKNARKAYVLTDTSIEYSRTVCSYFERRWNELSGTSIVGKDIFQNSDPSVATQISRFKGAPASDFLTLCSYTPGGASAIKQIRAAGITETIVTASSMDGTYWLGAIPNLSNVIIPTIASIYGDDPRPAVNSLVQQLEKKGFKLPNAYTLYGYSVVEAVAKAIEIASKQAGGTLTLDGSKLAKALETFRGVKLLVGPATFTSKLHQNIERPMAMMEIQNGKYRFTGFFQPSRVPPVVFR